MWRVMFHLLSRKALILGLLLVMGIGAGTEGVLIALLPATILSVMLLGQDKSSMRALRMLPLTSTENAASYWFATQGIVVFGFLLAGLSTFTVAALASAGQHDFASLITAWAMLVIFQGSLLVWSKLVEWYSLRRSLGDKRHAGPAALVAIAALITAGSVAWAYFQIVAAKTHVWKPWTPFRAEYVVLAVAVAAATFHWRTRLFTLALYPAARTTADLDNGKWANGFEPWPKAVGFGQLYSNAVRLALVALIKMSTALAVVVLMAAFHKRGLHGIRDSASPLLFMMALIAGVSILHGVKALPNLRDLIPLPLTKSQLGRHMAGYGLVLFVAVGSVFGPLWWYLTDLAMLSGAAVVLSGLSLLFVSLHVTFERSEDFHAMVIGAFASIYLLVLATKTHTAGTDSHLLFVLFAVGATYALVGIALLHHAIARSSRPYRTARREEGG